MKLHPPAREVRGQALVETALVLPLFIMVVVGIIVIGIGLFYQQQITNAAREAARYTAIHSATALCPTRSWKDVNLGMVPDPSVLSANADCDPPATQWPKMQAHGRERAGFGFVESDLHFAACWSGYTEAATTAYDAPPFAGYSPSPVPNVPPVPCTIGLIDPVASTSSLPCPPPPTVPADDKASNLAVSSLGTANQVTVYACYEWRPPLAGFLLIPETVTMRATITEQLQHQR
jgi:TadE-like protein